MANDWGGPLFLTAEDRDERVGRLVITPCEAFENFPPGLPGRFAYLGTRTDLSAGWDCAPCEWAGSGGRR